MLGIKIRTTCVGVYKPYWVAQWGAFVANGPTKASAINHLQEIVYNAWVITMTGYVSP